MSPTHWAARVDAAAAIELDGLVRRYGERTALDGVSVTVPAGATLVVFGPNGAGKSTLLRVLATLLRPQGGTARVLGNEPLLHRDLTARENLRFHARLHGVAFDRIDALLDQVGLALRGDEPIRELSRGMVQRVAACRAVLHEPDVLLLDEPTANLDPAAADALEPLVGRSSGRTRVVTSHDPARGLAEADVVLGLRAGRPELSGTATEHDVRGLYR
jgi:heme exporter protein A